MNRRSLAAAIVVALAGSLVGPTIVRSAPITAARAANGAFRDVPYTPGASCDLVTAGMLAVRHPTSRQFVIVGSDSWGSTQATLQIVVRSRTGQWRGQQGPVAARVRKSGHPKPLERPARAGKTAPRVVSL